MSASASHVCGNTGAGVSLYKGQFPIEQETVPPLCRTCVVYRGKERTADWLKEGED